MQDRLLLWRRLIAGPASDSFVLKRQNKFELERFVADPQPSPSTEANGSPALTKTEAAAWRRRVTSSLANAFVRQGNWRLALTLLEAMGEEECSPVVPEPGVDTACCGKDGTPTAAQVGAFRVEVLSRIGRVFLQLGALKDAEVYFRRAAEVVMGRGNGDGGDDDPRVSACGGGTFSGEVLLWF